MMLSLNELNKTIKEVLSAYNFTKIQPSGCGMIGQSSRIHVALKRCVLFKILPTATPPLLLLPVAVLPSEWKEMQMHIELWLKERKREIDGNKMSKSSH